jgi:hypothetical protein
MALDTGAIEDLCFSIMGIPLFTTIVDCSWILLKKT